MEVDDVDGGAKHLEATDVETTIIDPQGDIVLAVGDPVSCRIVVSATMLSSMSPVFKAMTQGRFIEGQHARSVINRQELALPEDDADAMLSFCYICHRQYEELSVRNQGAHQLHDLVVLIDKYQCLEKLQLEVRGLLYPFFRKCGQPDTFETAVLNVATAYLANDETHFESATEWLITGFNNAYSSVHLYKGGSVLSSQSLLCMSEVRESVQKKLLAKFDRACSDDDLDVDEIFRDFHRVALYFQRIELRTHCPRHLDGDKAPSEGFAVRISRSA